MKRRKQPEPWAAKIGTAALNPIQAMELQEAVRDHKKRVQLEGRWFKLTYSDDGETVMYKPEQGYAPMGYLRIDRFLSDY